MKFVSVAIFAFLCVAAVSAAPAELSEELAFGPFSLLDKLKGYYQKMRCTIEVASKIVSEHKGLEKQLDEMKSNVEYLFNVEWEKCDSAGNKFAVLKCKSGVMVQLGQAFATFTQKVYSTNKELADKIRQETESECTDKYDLFELDEEDFDSAEVEEFALFSISDKLQKYLEKYLEMVRCAFDAIGAEVAENEELGKAFEETKKDVEDLLYVQWKKCDNAATAIGAAKCKFGVIAKLGSTFTKFVQKVSVTNLEMAKRIEQALKQCWKA